ncbi:hypothetical protein EE612_031689 [Oryza sativa]|nr:hypothetical protein EE612_031689 [Oryza sativa]KAB8101022.1 hypothetical protein EE612_031689 [Oryza sativa]
MRPTSRILAAGHLLRGSRSRYDPRRSPLPPPYSGGRRPCRGSPEPSPRRLRAELLGLSRRREVCPLWSPQLLHVGLHLPAASPRCERTCIFPHLPMLWQLGNHLMTK